MFSIGQLSKDSGVKVPTIRYYESIGLLPEPGRNTGNQRRYDGAARDRLRFIHHARALGFAVDDIRALIKMSDHPERPCMALDQIARDQLAKTRTRIARLQALEAELARIVANCEGEVVGNCSVLAALGDHSQCAGPHGPTALSLSDQGLA
ncbi:MerR family transcriptional regulator [Pseudorhodobacter sp. E13]|uniref:MerR family transcriptional regulator n=1 Tax=Pseudorhodobacter sp. E13 TaxID=2487931 RepID=UPI000F8ED020|nr:helix-turn-helix domain-containing protein [Pseudorhodobacter sp. E13]RUS60404.1 MerR family transcriptional regulator [Pseudorhodobacter sp. E13]